MKNKIWHHSIYLISIFFILTVSCKKDDDEIRITDIDGNVYSSVTIGTQVWMVENLKTTHFRNGDSIPNCTDFYQWINLTTSAYCNYDYDESVADIYGRLYNWYAVNDSRDICPSGWHIPSDEEWAILETFLGGDSIAGGKIKETGTSHWEWPNMGATNESGFTGLPGGRNEYERRLDDCLGTLGCWWSSTEVTNEAAFGRAAAHSNNSLLKVAAYKSTGYSIRCVKD